MNRALTVLFVVVLSFSALALAGCAVKLDNGFLRGLVDVQVHTPNFDYRYPSEPRESGVYRIDTWENGKHRVYKGRY